MGGRAKTVAVMTHRPLISKPSTWTRGVSGCWSFAIEKLAASLEQHLHATAAPQHLEEDTPAGATDCNGAASLAERAGPSASRRL